LAGGDNYFFRFREKLLRDRLSLLLLVEMLLALLAVWHNHRVAPRGVHQGRSPLQPSGQIKEATDWLVALGYPHVPGIEHLTVLKDEERLVA